MAKSNKPEARKKSSLKSTSAPTELASIIKKFEAAYSPSSNVGRVTLYFTDGTSKDFPDLDDSKVNCLISLLTHSTRTYNDGIISITG